MIEQYCSELQLLRNDRQVYIGKRQHAIFKGRLKKQQNMYQGYIISQMQSKDRLVAVYSMESIASTAIKKQLSLFMRKIMKQRDSFNGSNGENIMAARLATIILAQFQKKLISKSFSAISTVSKKEQKVERVGRIYKHSVLRNSLQKIMMYKGANYRPFEDEISIIGGHKPKGTEFDSISFMMDQNQCVTCQSSAKLFSKMETQNSNLRQQLSELKAKLAFSEQALQQRNEEQQKLKSSNYVDQGESGSSSYYYQLQQQILGRPQKPAQTQHLEKELLAKYMRQTLQMREKMDLVRELCQQMELSCENDEDIREKILDLLTPEGKGNLQFDDQ